MGLKTLDWGLGVYSLFLAGLLASWAVPGLHLPSLGLSGTSCPFTILREAPQPASALGSLG